MLWSCSTVGPSERRHASISWSYMHFCQLMAASWKINFLLHYCLKFTIALSSPLLLLSIPYISTLKDSSSNIFICFFLRIRATMAIGIEGLKCWHRNVVKTCLYSTTTFPTHSLRGQQINHFPVCIIDMSFDSINTFYPFHSSFMKFKFK